MAKYDLKLKTLVGAVAAKYLTKDSAENLLKDLVRGVTKGADTELGWSTELEEANRSLDEAIGYLDLDYPDTADKVRQNRRQTSRAQGSQGWSQGHQGQEGRKGQRWQGQRKGPLREGEEEQEWPEGDGQDGEQAGDGDLGFLCVLGPSADSAPGAPPAAPGQICRPAFGPVFWTWSQPWKVALAECQVGVKDGAPNYWCPCPGCKGQKKRFSEDALTQHLWSDYVRPAMPSVVGQWAHIVGAEPRRPGG